MQKSYKDLFVWQKGIQLVGDVYAITGKLPKEEIYCLAAQMRRSAISIPSNIAEGQQRKNLKEFLQFLRVSYGSAAELETQLIILKMLYKIDIVLAESKLLEIRKMLNSMIKKFEINCKL